MRFPPGSAGGVGGDRGTAAASTPASARRSGPLDACAALARASAHGGRLRLAGEYCSKAHPGTVHGALLSGRHAARELLRLHAPPPRPPPQRAPSSPRHTIDADEEDGGMCESGADEDACLAAASSGSLDDDAHCTDRISNATAEPALSRDRGGKYLQVPAATSQKNGASAARLYPQWQATDASRERWRKWHAAHEGSGHHARRSVEAAVESSEPWHEHCGFAPLVPGMWLEATPY